MSARSATMFAAVIAFTVIGLAAVPRHATRVRWRRFLRQASQPQRLNVPASGKPPAAKIRRASAQLRAALEQGRCARPASAGVGALVGLLAGGPVGALVLAGYGWAGAHLAQRHAAQRAKVRSGKAAVEAVATLAAELRAGIAVGTALAQAAPLLSGAAVVGEEAATVARRVAAAVQVAETSGAPLADVLDRLDAHLRAVDRARATATAQAAGARASALLLAVMPVAGAGLGFLVGIDPLDTLLHTSIGAASLVSAVALQLGGLAWAGHLSRVEVAA